MEGISHELKNLGIEVVDIPQEMFENSRLTEEKFSEMQVDSSIDAVVSGYMPKWTFRALCYASLLIRGKLLFVSPH